MHSFLSDKKEPEKLLPHEFLQNPLIVWKIHLPGKEHRLSRAIHVKTATAFIKESSLLPMHCDYRVFIIDEAHMITNDAFNALLKTLEEPPETVIFILATTNMEKVPKTIQSRCVIINFKKAKKDDVVKMLKRVSKAENLEIEPKLLELIANNSEESFRDAAKLLEELVIQKKLTFKEGETYLGILGKEHLLEVLHKKDLKETLTWIEEFSTAGGNVVFF